MAKKKKALVDLSGEMDELNTFLSSNAFENEACKAAAADVSASVPTYDGPDAADEASAVVDADVPDLDIPVEETPQDVPEAVEETPVPEAVEEAVEEAYGEEAYDPDSAVEELPLEDVVAEPEAETPSEEAPVEDVPAVEEVAYEVPAAEEVEVDSAEEAVETAAEAVGVTTEESVEVKTMKETASAVAEAPAPTVAVAAAAPVVQPDYNTRLMRKEKDGYAGTFRLADGEQVVSMYRALQGKGLGGRVYLTNRRFLVEASLHTELPITKVAGISTGKFSRVRVIKLILSILFMAVCAGVFVAFMLPQFLADWSVFEDMAWLKYVFFGLGGVLGFAGFLMFCTSFSRRFVLSIFTEGVEQGFSIRSGVAKDDVSVYQPIAFGNPGKDYRRFRSEVGARLAEIRASLGLK